LRKFRRPTNSESWGFDMVISSITFDYEDSIMQIIPVEIENVEIEMGSVLTIDIKNSLYGRIRLETCVHDPISKRWAIHFKLIVVCERRTLARATFFGSLLRRVPRSAFPQPSCFNRAEIMASALCSSVWLVHAHN